VSPLDRARRLTGALRSGPRRVALAWAVAALAGLGASSGAPGISRDEAATIEAAARLGGARPELPPAAASGEAGREVRPQPPLLPVLSAATHAAASRIGISHLVAHRLPTVLLAALLAALLALLGFELAGAAGALLAPALYLAVPRLLHLCVVATPETALAALTLATVWAYRRSGAGSARGRVRFALVAGLAFGGALAARLDAWILLPVLAVHALAAGLLGRRGAGPAAGAPPRTSAAVFEGETRLPGVVALAAMGVLGPLVLLALSPGSWTDPVRRLAAIAAAPAPAWDYLGARLGAGRPPLLYPALVTALALPAGILGAAAGGLLHAIARLVRAGRGARGIMASDEGLLLLAAAAPLLATALGAAPLRSGVRPWIAAFPFLALLGARALLAAARLAWPARASALSATLALFVLWPAMRQTVRAWPSGAAAWGELAGGAPGAASLGMQRQDGGEASQLMLAEVSARARSGARVLLAGVPPTAVRLHLADGRLRPDLVPVETPADADIAVVPLDGGSRDLEYQVWSAFRTARPSAGAFLDEVPLVLVYARPGAWR
jgi:hypothetical protein